MRDEVPTQPLFRSYFYFDRCDVINLKYGRQCGRNKNIDSRLRSAADGLLLLLRVVLYYVVTPQASPKLVDDDEGRIGGEPGVNGLGCPPQKLGSAAQS